MAKALTTLDRFGRVVLPKSVRRALGVDAGAVFRIETEEGAVRLRPVEPENDLAYEEGVLVHRGTLVGEAQDPVQAEREGRLRHLLSTVLD